MIEIDNDGADDNGMDANDGVEGNDSTEKNGRYKTQPIRHRTDMLNFH